jgi:hypothetical protein
MTIFLNKNYLNFPAKYKAIQLVNENVKLECPEGNDFLPSSISERFGLVHSNSITLGWPIGGRPSG